MTNQTSRNVNFVQQNRSECYDNNRRQTQYQQTKTNFKLCRGNLFQQNSKNNNTNYKPKKNKMNLKTSRNNKDARQNLKTTFQNADYHQTHMQKQPVKAANRKIWARHTPIIRISNARTTKIISTKKPRGKRSSYYPCTWYSRTRWYYQRRSTFFISRPQPNRLDRVKVTQKIINHSSKPLTEWQINLLRRRLKFTPTPKPNTIELKRDIQEFTRKLELIVFLALYLQRKVTFTHPVTETNFLTLLLIL